MPDVVCQLAQRFLDPFRRNALCIKRGELSLSLIFEGEIELRGLVSGPMPQYCARFARVVVTVMVEKYNLSANTFLQPPGRIDFSNQKTLGKKSAGLLAKTNYWSIHALDFSIKDLEVLSK
jgi:hypothetical protein